MRRGSSSPSRCWAAACSTHRPGTYVTLARGFTTMGAVAGALGSSLGSDRAVRQAAYGYREEQRRAREAAQKQQDRQRS
ncbi:hypothetical protein [Salinifilum ghardaiensis]